MPTFSSSRTLQFHINPANEKFNTKSRISTLTPRSDIQPQDSAEPLSQPQKRKASNPLLFFGSIWTQAKGYGKWFLYCVKRITLARGAPASRILRRPRHRSDSFARIPFWLDSSRLLAVFEKPPETETKRIKKSILYRGCRLETKRFTKKRHRISPFFVF